MIITVPEIWRVKDVITFRFGLFFALLPPTAQKIKKRKKKLGDIIIFHKYSKNYD